MEHSAHVADVDWRLHLDGGLCRAFVDHRDNQAPELRLSVFGFETGLLIRISGIPPIPSSATYQLL